MQAIRCALLVAVLVAAVAAGCFWIYRTPGSSDRRAQSNIDTHSVDSDKGAQELRDPEASPSDRAAQLNELLNNTRGDATMLTEEVTAVLMQWAEQDPTAALEYALTPLIDDNVNAAFLEAVPNVMGRWAGRDPDSARSFMEARSSDAAMVRYLAPAMMRSYSRQRPDEAFAWVTTEIESDSDEMRPLLGQELVTTFVEIGRSEQVRVWLSQPNVAQSAYAQPAVTEFSRHLSATEPHEALRFAESLPQGTFSRGLALQEAVRQWTSRDPVSTYKWLTDLIQHAESSRSSSAPVFSESVESISGYSETEIDHLLAGYVSGLPSGDRDEARQNAASILDPSLRARMLELLKL